MELRPQLLELSSSNLFLGTSCLRRIRASICFQIQRVCRSATNPGNSPSSHTRAEPARTWRQHDAFFGDKLNSIHTAPLRQNFPSELLSSQGYRLPWDYRVSDPRSTQRQNDSNPKPTSFQLLEINMTSAPSFSPSTKAARTNTSCSTDHYHPKSKGLTSRLHVDTD